MTLAVFGHRYWEKGAFGGLAPSKPMTFESMPLTYGNAFGGKAKTEYGELPYANNPVGKGYYFSEKNAAGQPLPNIENPSALIRKWDDRPDPAGIAPYPMQWGLRSQRAMIVDEQSGKADFAPGRGMFNKAHPALSMKQIVRRASDYTERDE